MSSSVLSLCKGFWHSAAYLTYSRLLPPRSFAFNGSSYRYFYHRYNNTSETERAIEIPVALDFLRTQPAEAVLEVGNVLNHYAYFPHTVVDKYEIADGVLNVDISDFNPDQKYDAIVSISTVEHVGWDEEPFDPDKSLQAIYRLRQMLAPGGRMLLSIPIGHHAELDRAIQKGALACTTLRGLRRTRRNNWVETPLPELLEYRVEPSYRPSYDRYRRINAVAFAYF
jgi:hypothetical protein